MYEGFRLTRLHYSVPLTCRLLGERRLAVALPRFWSEKPPFTFYFTDEGLAFCAFLKKQMRRARLKVPYLADVLAYERAILEFDKARKVGRAKPQRVTFAHDPEHLLPPLRAGSRPRRLALKRVTLEIRHERGQVRWHRLGAS